MNIKRIIAFSLIIASGLNSPIAAQHVRDVNGNSMGDIADIQAKAADLNIYLPLVVAQRGQPWLTPTPIPALTPTPSSNTVVVRPTEDSQSLYANPGMGWQTFYKSADEDANLAGLPSTTMYRRFGWNEFEPEEGRFDFSLFEHWLGRAQQNGQRLAWRLMVAASKRTSPTTPLLGFAPLWLMDKGASGYIYYRDSNQNGRQDENEPDLWAPDLADPIARSYHDRLVAELGRRYDGHPFLDLLDIGSVGLWGEWHFWGAVIKEIVGNPPSGYIQAPGNQSNQRWVAMPPEDVRKSIIDTWMNAFPATPKAMLIGDRAGMSYATGIHRTGWRADCWGDMAWHMPNFYDQQLRATNATEAWRNGPVALEPCWDMQHWRERGWNISEILDWALSHHATYIQNKSHKIPQDWLSQVQRALRTIGYRLVLRELQHPRVASRGAPFTMVMTWENVGVAPPYWDYFLKVRLKQGNTEWISPALLSIKGWQPGTRGESVEIPSLPNLPTGEYELALGIFSSAPEHIHPNLKFVKIAIQTPHDEGGWYPLSRIRLR